MSNSTTFIINPAAGFGKTKRYLKTLLKEIHHQSPQAKVELTGHSLHAIGLTKTALKEGVRRIIVVGGDGTLNEVVNGFFDEHGQPLNPDASIGVVPCGTGSDFSRTINHSNNLKEAVEHALMGKALPTDVGLVEAHDANGVVVKRYFINVSSMGISGLVAGFMKTVTKRLGGKSAYFISTMQAIRAFKPQVISVRGLGLEKTLENCSLVSFANGKYFGSGMKISPDAELDDGFLDVVTIQDLGPMFFLVNGIKVYQGTHLELSNVHSYRQSECVVESMGKEPVYIETDGELFAELPAKYSVKSKGILMVR